MLKLIPYILLLAPTAALPQDGARVGGPVAGFVFDSAQHALRPILGVPGASHLGPAVVSAVDYAAISPDGASALAISEGHLVLVSGLFDPAPAMNPIDVIDGVDRIAWSPNGAFAAVYSSAARQVSIVRDLPRTPAAGAAIHYDDPITALAVSSAGDLLAGSENGVFLLAPGAAPQLLASATRPVALSFRGLDLFVADAAGRILMVENFAAAPAVSVFADGVPAPVGLQISADGKRLFVASAETRQLVAFDVAGRNPIARADLDTAPAELRPTGGRDLWLLNADIGAGPLYIATGERDPAVWFVPDGREQ